MIRQFLRHGGWIGLICLGIAGTAFLVWLFGAPDDITLPRDDNTRAAGWVALGFGGLSLSALWISLTLGASALRIIRRGIPRQGVVTGIVGINNTSRIMRYEWTGGDGGVHTSNTRARGRDRFADFPPGTAIRLLEDPVNPARAIWEQDLR